MQRVLSQVRARPIADPPTSERTCGSTRISPPPQCARALVWERARHHGNEFVGEGVVSTRGESDLVFSSTIQHPTGDVEMFSGKSFVAF